MTDIKEPIQGRRTTEEQLFYCQVGDQLIKDTLPFLNQVLRQLVTLAAALIAGSVAIIDKEMLARPLVGVAMFMLLLSLACALLGILPYGGRMIRRAPGEISRSLQWGIGLKSWLCWASAGFMFVALLILVIGIVNKNQ